MNIMELSGTHNLDKLTPAAIGMINILFKYKLEGYENAYMVEVPIDNPETQMKNGNFIIHTSPNEYLSQAKHLFDKNWAVVHKNTFKNITKVDEEKFEKLIKIYFEEVKNAKCKKICKEKTDT